MIYIQLREKKKERKHPTSITQGAGNMNQEFQVIMFNGISTLMGYLMPYLVIYIYIYIYIYIGVGGA